MIRFLQPIKEDIIKGSLLISGFSLGISVFITVLTVDLTSSLFSFLEELITGMRNVNFLFGCVVVLLGLILAFLKPPSHSSTSQTDQKFVPKYPSKNISFKGSNNMNSIPSSSSMFSPRELKLVFSGLVAIIISMSIWIGYLFIKFLVL
jgi:hypothetical protein